ncbi:MAG: phosphatase PAP2 family protein, partial [SAR202 cluster bacterium]|nr:phosphatase PAP2 family protein [SAR202 cluster bacterium]
MRLRGVAGALLALAVGVFWLARSRLEAVFLATVAVPDMFNLLVRALIGRERPPQDLVDVVGGPQGFSFPSGTALHAILFYPFVLYLASRYISSTRLRYGLWGLCTLYVLATGLWLIYNGRHWFTDVMGGYLYGVFYLLVIVAALKAARSWVREG